jgi:hypothetical protein
VIKKIVDSPGGAVAGIPHGATVIPAVPKPPIM